MIVFIVNFVLSFFINLFYAMYVKHLTKNNILKAAIFSELVVIAAYINTITIIDNHWCIVPTVMGGFSGTLFIKKIN